MSQKQELQKQETKALTMSMEEWGTAQKFTANDIVIPKILPLQFMSEKVKNKQGEYGEFRDTLNNDKFGDISTPVEVIPFHVQKKWMEFDVITNKAGAKKREYKRTIAIDATNDNLPYVDADGLIERDRCVDVYVLIPKHIEEGNSFPYVLSFRRTSLKAGNKVITQILRNERMGKPPAAVTMLLSAKTVQNDAGEFVVQDVQTGRVTTLEEMQDCLSWYKLVASGVTRVDESGEEEVAATKTVSRDDDKF